MKKLSKFVDTRIGFFTLLVVLFGLKPCLLTLLISTSGPAIFFSTSF